MTIEELLQALRNVMGETDGYPYRVARELRHYLLRADTVAPIDMARAIVNGILCELEVQWDRSEDAPTWPDDI